MVAWINMSGIHDIGIMEDFGEQFGIHSLVLEDILHTGQRPKMEDYGEYIFFLLQMFMFDDETRGIKVEQVSFILGPRFVISFQEREEDVLELIRERLRKSKGRIRKMGADYLFYSLMDAIVDYYFVVLERIGERIEVLEEELVAAPGPDTLAAIHALRREMIFFRKSTWPLREAISRLQRTGSPLIDESVNIYIQDVYDHVIQTLDTVETYREMVSGMLETYLSSVSNRMNEVMKVLTIIATIFIPLTFIAGIYGMNFEYMPELGWHWGYYTVWGVMAAAALAMVYFFRRKKWL